MSETSPNGDNRRPSRARARSRWPLPRLGRDERGQSVVEFALVLPVLMLILVGILEFGWTYSNVISMRQGVREAGRQGSVAQWGSTTNCGLSLVPPNPSVNIQKLMCLTKDQSGVTNSIRVRVKFAKANLTSGGSYVKGDALVMCAVYPLGSLTGLFEPFLGGRYARTRAAFRIENLDAAGATAGGEADPSRPPGGEQWDWC